MRVFWNGQFTYFPLYPIRNNIANANDTIGSAHLFDNVICMHGNWNVFVSMCVNMSNETNLNENSKYFALPLRCQNWRNYWANERCERVNGENDSERGEERERERKLLEQKNRAASEMAKPWETNKKKLTFDDDGYWCCWNNAIESARAQKIPEMNKSIWFVECDTIFRHSPNAVFPGAPKAAVVCHSFCSTLSVDPYHSKSVSSVVVARFTHTTRISQIQELKRFLS